MKALALSAIVLFAACSSATDVIDERTLPCDSGQDISVMAGVNGTLRGDLGRDDRFELLVEVSNNSHEDLYVRLIRVQQLSADDALYQIDGASQRFDQLVEEGKDHTFRLPLTGRLRTSSTRSISGDRGIELAVTVGLTNGDSYRCVFDVGNPR